MGKARASIDLPGQVSAAETLWYDLRRWPSFIDGFGHVDKVEGDWPQEGSRVRWSSTPGGRGLVMECVSAYEVRAGQTVEVEDPRMQGTQSVAFEPLPEGRSRMTIELQYGLKSRMPLNPLVDAIFIRRAMNDALRRTLTRFRRELQGDLELER